MAMSRDEIYQKVQAVLVDALGVDEEEVTPTAVVRDDLGAESIDFLDIMFRLEKAFGIKIPKGEMMPENLANDPPSNIVSCTPCVLVPQALHRAFAMNATHDFLVC